MRLSKVCLYIVLWFLLQDSTENRVNSKISEQFAVSAIDNTLIVCKFTYDCQLPDIKTQKEKVCTETVVELVT